MESIAHLTKRRNKLTVFGMMAVSGPKLLSSLPFLVFLHFDNKILPSSVPINLNSIPIDWTELVLFLALSSHHPPPAIRTSNEMELFHVFPDLASKNFYSTKTDVSTQIIFRPKQF